jgi:dUTP pyrophosphatase
MKGYRSLLTTNIVRMPEIIRYKKLDPNVPDLKRHSEGAAGYDLYNITEINSTTYPLIEHKIPTGVAIEIPYGYCGLILARSSSRFGNQYGSFVVDESVIDSDYRGQIHIAMRLGLTVHQKVPQYTRLAQLIIAPCFMEEMELVDELSPTERGDKGFGSTG